MTVTIKRVVLWGLLVTPLVLGAVAGVCVRACFLAAAAVVEGYQWGRGPYD